MSGPEAASTRLGERVAANIELSRFKRRWEAERLKLYRRQLQIGVVAASPLVAELERSHGIDVRAYLWRLRPPFGWPEGSRTRDGSGAATDCRFDVRGVRGGWIRRNGASVTIRSADARLASVTLRIADGALEMSTTIGEVAVRTELGVARLRLPFRLPNQIASAALGQPIECLVAHPWFAGHGWRIRDVVDRGTVDQIVVGTGQITFEMPWRRTLLRGCDRDDAPGTGR